MSFLRFLKHVEDVSEITERLAKRGGPSWAVPASAIAASVLIVCFGLDDINQALNESYRAPDTVHVVGQARDGGLLVDDGEGGVDRLEPVLSRELLESPISANATWSPWSDASAEFTTPTGVDPDMFMPPGMDTVTRITFNDAYPVSVAGAGDESGSRSPVGVNNWTGDAQGRQILAGAQTADRALDTMTLANMASPPGMYEARYDGANINAGADYHHSFSNGTGPLAASSVGGTIYTRLTLKYEDASMCVSCVDYETHPNGEKIFRFYEPGAGLLLDWQLGGITVVNTSGDGDGCGEPYSNVWPEYYPWDTLPTQFGCGTQGQILPEDPELEGHVIHLWFCSDAGRDVMAFGIVSENQQGIAGYWTETGLPSSYTGLYTDHTYGGGNPPWPQAQSRWYEDLFVAADTSGTAECPKPPSMS